MEEEVECESCEAVATPNPNGHPYPSTPTEDTRPMAHRREDPQQDFDLLYSEEIDETSSGASHAVVSAGLAPAGEEKIFRGKNKRTVAAVSPADRTAALTAMEELRGRGATTEDLVCRLCGPPRPFTAYSTLLTHYRQENGAKILLSHSSGVFFAGPHEKPCWSASFSVGDPDPKDPHVFWPPGSGSGPFPFLINVLNGLK